MQEDTDKPNRSSAETPSKEVEISVSKDCLIRMPAEQTQRKEMTVVLFGWGNALFKNLKKYSSLYESLGYTTVLVRTYVIESALMPKLRSIPSLKLILSKLKEILPRDKDNPAIVQVFSTSGNMRYHFFTSMLNDPNSPFFNMFDVRGLIFDSNPTSVDNGTQVAFDAFRVAVKNPVFRFLGGILIKIITPLIIMFSSDANEIRHETLHSSWKCPQLYLYSRKDEISDPSFIDYVANFHKQNGTIVSQKCWEESSHCAHLLKYPDEYKEEVNKFLTENQINE